MLKNVVYIYDQSYLSGGAAKIAFGEALEMQRKGYNVIFFAAIGPVGEELLSSDIKTICLNEKHIAFTKSPKALYHGIWNSKAYKELRKCLNELDRESTIVHIHGWTKSLSSSVVRAVYDSGFEMVVTLHEYFSICQNGGLFNYRQNKICDLKPGSARCYFCDCDKRNYLQKWYRNIRQIIQNRVLKQVKPNVIYITGFSKDRLSLSGNYRNKCYDLTNFVEIEKKERVQVEKNENYLFVGRISAEKGIDVFCEAITAARIPGIVIGEGPLKKEYKEKYPEISFVGWKNHNEMMEYLHKARGLVISSKWYETMGLTVVEMQQYGIPCVVPAECAASEYIKDKVDGLLYTIGDSRSLTKCLKALSDDKYIEKLSITFLNNLDRERFSMQNHSNKLVGIYNDILKIGKTRNDKNTR